MQQTITIACAPPGCRGMDAVRSPHLPPFECILDGAVRRQAARLLNEIEP
ncbi:MAG: hypothetical protein KDJ86_18360 [Bauldia sp.]|nr:hypothetical protein [Bauldia sp.]MCB1497751.1 hypothetical protein [Bauldia sp.]